MEGLSLDKQTYDWLVSLQLLVPGSAKEPNLTPQGLVRVSDEEVVRELTAGVTHKHLLLRLAEMNPGGHGGGTKAVLEELESLSDSTNEPAKLANWIKLVPILAQFPGLTLSKSAIDELMEGHHKIATDILGQIYSVCLYKGKNMFAKGSAQLQPGSGPAGGLKSAAAKGPSADSEPPRSRMDLSPLYPPEKTQQVQNLSPDSGFGECTNCLEFLCLAMAKETGVQPVQIVPLFNEESKNWNSLLAKGKNGDQRSVINFFKHIVANLSAVNRLVKLEEKQGSVEFFLEAIKPGLLSKDLRVAALACSSFRGVLKELADRKALEPAWRFFKKVYGGFLALIGCFDTFGDRVIADVFSVVREIGKHSLLKMFKEEFRRMLPDPAAYATFLNHILNVYLSKEEYAQELVDSGVIEHVVKFAISGMESPSQKSPDTGLMAYFELCCRLIAEVQAFFTAHQSLTGQVFGLFRDTALASPLLFLASMALLSDLLSSLASSKSSLAPPVFKIVCHLHKASLGSRALREFSHKALTQLLREIKTLPADIICEATLDFVLRAGDDEDMDLNCFETIEECVSHDSLDLSYAMKMAHKLGEICRVSRYYPTMWGLLLKKLVARFSTDEAVCDEVKKVVAGQLTFIYQSEVEASKKNPRGGVVLKEELSMKETILRFSVLNSIKSIIEAKSPIVNMGLPPLLLFANRQIRVAAKKNHRGLLLLLSFLVADPELAMKEYDQKQNEVGQIRREMGIGEFKTDIANLSGTLEKRQLAKDPDPDEAEEESPDDDAAADSGLPLINRNASSPALKKAKDRKGATKRPGAKPKKSGKKESDLDPLKEEEDDRRDSDNEAERPSLPREVVRAKSATELPGYLKGTEPEALNPRMKYFDLLKQQEQNKKYLQEKKAEMFAKRAKEIKERVKYFEAATVSSLTAPKKDLEKEKKKEEEMAKEGRRRERHVELLKSLNEYSQKKKQDIDEKKQAHRQSMEEAAKKKLRESRRFVKSRVKEFDEQNKAVLFLHLFREQFEKERGQLRVFASGNQLEKIKREHQKLRERINTEKAVREFITNQLNSQGTKAMMNEFRDPIEVLFEFFSRIDPEPRNNGTVAGEKRVQCRTFFEFLNMFNVLPAVIETEAVQVMYRDTVQGKTVKWLDDKELQLVKDRKSGLKLPDAIKEIPVGVNFKQFQELLLRLSLKKKSTFDKCAFDPKPDEQKIVIPVRTEFRDFQSKEFFDKKERKRLEEVADTYENLKDYHYTSFENFMHFFKLPRTRDDIFKKLAFMRKEYLTKAKPAELKDRPKSMTFSKWHKKNQGFRVRKLEDALMNLFSDASMNQQLDQRAQSAKKARDQILEEVDKEKSEKKKEKLKKDLETSKQGQEGGGGVTVEKKTLIEEKEEEKKKKPSKKKLEKENDDDSGDSAAAKTKSLAKIEDLPEVAGKPKSSKKPPETSVTSSKKETGKEAETSKEGEPKKKKEKKKAPDDDESEATEPPKKKK